MLVEITEADHGILLDLTYATPRNFTGAPIYARPACFLHPDAFALLIRARDLAGAQGLRLRIFDAFRPAEAQRAMWRHTPDPAFVADPAKGSNHSRGVAVDLTLADAGSGAGLAMGTPFDSFLPQSHHGRTDIPREAQANRSRLLGIMTAAGWEFYGNEWWHYQMFGAAARYPLLSDSVLPRSMMQGETP